MLLGDSGTGKSHLLIGLGHGGLRAGPLGALCHLRRSWSTNWPKPPTTADCPASSRATGASTSCCLDELGYVQLDTRGAELLFQILTEREEKSSVAVACNLPFSEWGQVVTDPRLVAAIVDRLTFNAHIIETGTDSLPPAHHQGPARARAPDQRTRCRAALASASEKAAGSNGPPSQAR